MNIRTKVISLLALLFVVLVAVEILVQRAIVMPSFAELERDAARISMKRIDYAIDESLSALAITAADWGNWSDVYRFVQAPDQEFVRTNVTPGQLRQLQVDMLLIVDRTGRVLLSSAAGAPGAHLDFAGLTQLPANFPWRPAGAAAGGGKGWIRTDAGLMMLAAAPVLDGTGGGRPLGMVLMGQLVTGARVRLLAARAQANLALAPADAPIEALRLSETGSTTRIEEPLADIYGRPLAILEVTVPRRITARGRDAVAYASAYLIAAAVAVMILMVVALNRLVLGPLARVTSHAVAVGEGDLAARLDVDSADEIGLLAREFDGMVERLGETRNELVAQSFHAGFAELAKGVLHNLGNAMTPLAVRLAKLKRRLREVPAGDLQRACRELAGGAADPARQADLLEFLRLGSLEVASAIAESSADLDVIERQTQLVQSALGELTRSARHEPAIEPVRLPELVSQTLEIVPDACRQRLSLEADESLGGVGAVHVARTVLRLVLQNLIINAADAVRDAGRERGVLRLGAEIVRENDREQLHLSCKDDGVGIAADDLERVFDKGWSTKSRETNSGIGLHWCANAIAALGGRIWAASEGRGFGASLHLMLPLANPGTRGWIP